MILNTVDMKKYCDELSDNKTKFLKNPDQETHPFALLLLFFKNKLEKSEKKP